MKPLYTSNDLALELGCSTRKIRNEASAIGVGINLGGRAGYRFTDEDRARLLESMRVKAPEGPRRKRRRSEPDAA